MKMNFLILRKENLSCHPEKNMFSGSPEFVTTGTNWFLRDLICTDFPAEKTIEEHLGIPFTPRPVSSVGYFCELVLRQCRSAIQ